MCVCVCVCVCVEGRGGVECGRASRAGSVSVAGWAEVDRLGGDRCGPRWADGYDGSGLEGRVGWQRSGVVLPWLQWGDAFHRPRN